MSVDRFSRLSAVLGRVVLGAETLALTLWLVAPQALPAVLLHRSPTKPSTVLGFLLLGAALGLRVRPRVRAGLLAAVAALALEGVLSQVVGRPLLTGGVLFPDRWHAVVPTGQMALSSALVLLCLVVAMAIGRSVPRAATGLGCLAFGIGFVSLVGHLFGAEDLSRLQGAVSMVPPTVPIALCATVAVLLERPELPASRAVRASGPGGALVRASLLWALVVPVMLGLAVVRGEEAGWFDPAFGQGLMVLLLTGGSIGAVVLGARVEQRADRHRAAAADRERLQYLLDGTPVGIFETDAQGRRTYANLRWRELTGISDDIAGTDWLGALHPADRERVAAEWASALEWGEPWTGRYRYLRSDGSVRWVDTAATAIRNPDGSTQRWLGSVTDVTEQVEASQQLRASERRYRSVVATMAEGVILQDAEGLLVTANQAASRIMGVDLAQLYGTRPVDPGWSVVREDGRPFGQDELPARRALATGKPVRDVTLGLQRRDGIHTWLVINAEPLHDVGADGMPVVTGVVTTFTDVTEARAASRALARSEEQFRSAMAHAPVGMALVALDGSFMEVNHALCRLVGYDEADLLGLTFQQITHAEDLGSDLDNLGLLTRGAIDHYTMEKRYITRGGDVVWVRLAVSMARDEADAPAHYIAQVQDISAERAAHAKLEHQALHDPLTGLANRDLLMDRLAHALARSTRSGHRTMVMFCDLDHFKEVNDSLGHEAGDAVLVTVADRLRAAVRPGDTVARLGGDEFVVVAEGVVTADDQVALAARVQAVLDQPVHVGDRDVRSGASIGVAVAGPDADARSVLREADAAMYRAKARGRGRYEMSHESPVGALGPRT
jgi:diguanylate cyclase (GGDEF)-like protein/PAS domain S-box-containing protein